MPPSGRSAFFHLTDIATGQVLNSQTPDQFLHFAREYARIKAPYYLVQSRLASFALDNKERNVVFLANLGYHKVYRTHPCIQPPKPVDTAILLSCVGTFPFFLTELLTDFSLHALLHSHSSMLRIGSGGAIHCSSNSLRFAV